LLLTWFAVKTRLEQMEEDYISYSEYQKMCEAEDVSDELSQQTLLGFLHDLGIVLSFHGHYILEDTNVLNPEWVTKGIYQILNSNELFQRKGVLERKALNHILDSNEYPRSKHQFIIDMMRKFELCFDFAEPDGERFLVPDLLSKEEPYVGEWENSLAFHYHYDILPGSVISRFIVRIHAYIFKKTYWRNGVVLVSEDGKNKALVKADIEDKKIFIYVSGRPETRSTFLAIIRADFRKIHASISKLNVKEKIPIPGYPGVVADYEHLLTLEELGEETFIPEGLRVKVRVKDLLHGVSGNAIEKPEIRETPGVFKNSGSLRVGQQIEELQQQWNLLSEKLSKLEQTKILETKVDERLRIEKLIEELTAERQQIGQQLNDLETKCSSTE
jgi:internalin A